MNTVRILTRPPGVTKQGSSSEALQAL